jgi:hypothetical protein
LREYYFTVWKTSVRNIFNHMLVLDACRLRSGAPSQSTSNRPRSVNNFLHSVNTAPPEPHRLTDAVKRVIFQRPTEEKITFSTCEGGLCSRVRVRTAGQTCLAKWSAA